MKFILHLLLGIFCVGINSIDAYSQQANDSLKNIRGNQFDVGVNFSYFFDRVGLAIDNDVASFPNDRKFIDILGAFHFGYKRAFGKHFCALINYQNFDFGRTFNRHISDKESERGDLLWRSGYKYIGAGAGYVLKKNRFQSVFSLQLGYAANDLYGARVIFWEYTPREGLPIWEQHMSQQIYYEDKYGFGISPAVDINYFVYKNIGIGCNFFLNYFPFAKSTFSGADHYIGDLTEEDIVKYNKPCKVFFSSNVKLVYRFRDPKFLR